MCGGEVDYILLGPFCKSHLVVFLIIYDSVNNSVLVLPWFFIILYGPMLSTQTRSCQHFLSLYWLAKAYTDTYNMSLLSKLKETLFSKFPREEVTFMVTLQVWFIDVFFLHTAKKLIHLLQIITSGFFKLSSI